MVVVAFVIVVPWLATPKTRRCHGPASPLVQRPSDRRDVPNTTLPVGHRSAEVYGSLARYGNFHNR